ncbi:tho complex subunit 7 domain-containing protein [Ditylenchus destructor]|nr:tho complex subunit 7 domain-containing protein [Ditylenchus destructor]
MSGIPLNEEAILRKLVADGDGTSEDRRIVQLFSLIGSLSSATDTNAVSTKILNALDQIELSITKQCMVAAVHEEETKNNEELFVEIDGLLLKNTERMEKVKEELSEAKLVRKNRQEYDILAKLIKDKPSRQETLETLRRLQAELDQDQERQKFLEQKLVDRRKNMYSLAILLNSLDEDALEADVQMSDSATNNEKNEDTAEEGEERDEDEPMD